MQHYEEVRQAVDCIYTYKYVQFNSNTQRTIRVICKIMNLATKCFNYLGSFSGSQSCSELNMEQFLCDVFISTAASGSPYWKISFKLSH